MNNICSFIDSGFFDEGDAVDVIFKTFSVEKPYQHKLVFKAENIKETCLEGIFTFENLKKKS